MWRQKAVGQWSNRRWRLSLSNPARQRVRQEFEIHAVDLRKTVSGKVDHDLCLLQRNVAEQCLVATIGRCHVDEERLRQNLAELSRSATGSARRCHRSQRPDWRFRPPRCHRLESAEPRPPRVWQGEVRGTRVDSGIADNPTAWIRAVLDGRFDDDSTHAGSAVRHLERNEIAVLAAEFHRDQVDRISSRSRPGISGVKTVSRSASVYPQMAE